MFICDGCGCSTKEGEAMNKLIYSTRPASYQYTVIRKKNKDEKEYIERFLTEEEIEEYKEQKYDIIKKFEKTGTEIVKEIKLCGACYEERKDKKKKV